MTKYTDIQREEQWRYDRPSLAVDGVLLRYHEEKVQVLLLKRRARFEGDDCEGKFSLVGGFQPNGLTLEENLKQKVTEKTGIVLADEHMEQLVTFSEPNRDERFWVISVAYLAYLPIGTSMAPSFHWKDQAYWVDISLNAKGELDLVVDELLLTEEAFAFDHYQILHTAMKRIAGRLSYLPTVLAMLPEKNTMSQYRIFYGQFEPRYLEMNSTDFLRKHKRFFTKTDQKVKTSKRQASLFRWGISYD